MKTINQHILFSIIGVLIVLTAITGINLYNQVQAIEESKLPVIIHMVAVKKRETSTYMDLHVFGDKKRQCGAPVAWTASYGDSSFRRFIFLDDLEDDGNISIPDSNEVKDKLDFGWWRFQPNPNDRPIIVKIFHICDELTVTTEFVLNPAKIKD